MYCASVFCVLMLLQSGSPVLPLEKRLEFPVLPVDGPMLRIVARGDGTALAVDPGNGTALEIRKGTPFSEFSRPNSQAAAVDFGPNNTRYILYADPKGPVFRVYSSTGRLEREIHPKNENVEAFPEAFAVDQAGNIVLFTVPARSPVQPFNYVRKYDTAGQLIYQALPAVIGQRNQGALVAAGQLDQTAVLRPDENRVYWFGSNGETVQVIRFDETVTALGFRRGRLIVAVADAIMRPSVNVGVHIRELSHPCIYIVDTLGEKERFELPEPISVISYIDPDGNLLQTSRDRVHVLVLAGGVD